MDLIKEWRVHMVEIERCFGNEFWITVFAKNKERAEWIANRDF